MGDVRTVLLSIITRYLLCILGRAPPIIVNGTRLYAVPVLYLPSNWKQPCEGTVLYFIPYRAKMIQYVFVPYVHSGERISCANVAITYT